MQIRQNQSFSAQTLRTHRHLFWECWGVVLLGVLLWLLELFAAALLLRIQDTPPASLLTEQAVLWRIVQACWLVPAWLAWTVCRWRLWYHCTGAVSLLPRCRPAGTGKRLMLALQNTLSNVAGGIMLLVTTPFQVGDYVEADGISGTVHAIDLSYTAILTIDGKEIFVPNSQLSGTKIINYTILGRRRVVRTVTASYDAPTEDVKAACLEAVAAVPGILSDPAPAVQLTNYGASSIEYTIFCWCSVEDYWPVYFAVNENLRSAFANHGVEMTYDHLNVHVVNK